MGPSRLLLPLVLFGQFVTWRLSHLVGKDYPPVVMSQLIIAPKRWTSQEFSQVTNMCPKKPRHLTHSGC